MQTFALSAALWLSAMVALPSAAVAPVVGQTFPTITGNSLAGHEVTFPDDVKGSLTVIAVAFERDAQKYIDTWAETLIDYAQADDGVRYYELPMISGSYSLVSGWIDDGMRGGIPEHLHDNVVTYYGDLDEYQKRLGVTDESTCYIYVLDRDGTIRYFKRGPAEQTDLDYIARKIDQLNN